MHDQVLAAVPGPGFRRCSLLNTEYPARDAVSAAVGIYIPQISGIRSHPKLTNAIPHAKARHSI